MTFAQGVDNLVRESRAYDNLFFSNCKNPLKQTDLRKVSLMTVNWYLITKYFALSAQEYDLLLARKLKNSTGKVTNILQHLLVESAMISGDDLGIGHQQLYEQTGGGSIKHNERIHYKLWATMVKRLLEQCNEPPIKPEDLEELNLESAKVLGILKEETHQLIRRIEDEFTSIEGGAIVYQVVESIAYNIVDAYSALMSRIKNGGKDIFKKIDLVYLEIHKPLEIDHDRQSTGIIELVESYFDRRYNKVIEIKVVELSNLFGDFWDAMNSVIFGNES